MTFWEWIVSKMSVTPSTTAATPAPQPVLSRLEAALAAVAPSLTVSGRAEWATALEPAMTGAKITTPRRAAMFVGQLADESQEFRLLTEDLDYTSSARLRAVFGAGYFPTVAHAEAYCGQPEKLANYIYANRNGNGPVASGDGWKFRGGGLIQLTGRANYAACGRAIGRTADELAELIRAPAEAALSAAWYWTWRGINARADVWDVAGATRLVNGGEVALATRTRLCDAALRVFS